jgi:hypothetical protein
MILIVVALTVAVGASSCAGSSAPEVETTGCRQDIRGISGEIRTETSKLSCDAINALISAIPSAPQAYSIMGESPPLLWNCRLYAAKGHTVLLRCTHDAEHFSIVKSDG